MTYFHDNDALPRPFRARYKYVDGQLVHVGCVPADEPEPRPVCPTCFLEIPLNGACGC